jgi:preprotein translocase subunit SecD
MLRIVLFASLLVAVTVGTLPIVKCQSAFEIRSVVDSLQQGALRIIDERSHQAIFVGAKPFFTISDVDSASVSIGSEADGKPLYAVNIQFRPSLNDSMRSLTGHLIGSRLAFVVDGRILATPRILDTIQTARVGLFATTEAEARELAKKITRAVRNH